MWSKTFASPREARILRKGIAASHMQQKLNVQYATEALQRVYEGDPTASRQMNSSVYDRVGALRWLAGKTAYRRNDCQDQILERYTVLRRHTILAIRGSEHWRPRSDPGQCDLSSKEVHPRGGSKPISLSTHPRASDRAAV